MDAIDSPDSHQPTPDIRDSIRDHYSSNDSESDSAFYSPGGTPYEYFDDQPIDANMPHKSGGWLPHVEWDRVDSSWGEFILGGLRADDVGWLEE